MHDEDETTLTGLAGIGVGEVRLWKGNICCLDRDGRLNIRSPRRADVHLAQRLVAAVQQSDDTTASNVLRDVNAIRETP